MTSRLPVGKRLFCCPRQGGAETTPPLQAFDLRWGLRASKEGRDLEAGTPTCKPCPPNLFKFMALHFQPNFGQILICDFPSQFTPPEMIKRRPVVCVSPKYRNRYGVATVVPLSTTEPKVKSQFNVSVRLEQCINDEYPTLQCWAKCDMLYTLNYSRLNAPLLGKREGKRQYNFMVLPPGTMCGILTGILAGLGIEGSVKYEGDTYKVFNLPFLDTTTTLW